MRKLKDCKNFGELYETIGEEKFSVGAKWLLTVLLISPIFWGIINYCMQIKKYYYDAYNYNFNCNSLTNGILGVITLWSFLYYFGKIRFKKNSFKELLSTQKALNPWILPWFALLVWTIVPMASSKYPLKTFFGTTYLSAGYITHIFMFGVMGCAAMLKEKDRETVFRLMVGVADGLALIFMAFEYQIPVLGKLAASGGMSVYTNQNHYGYYLAIACLIMIGGFYKCVNSHSQMGWTVFYLGSLIFNLYVLMINNTMGAYLAILFAAIIMIIIWKCAQKKLGIAAFVPLVIILAMTAISYMGWIPASRTGDGDTIGQSIIRMIQDILNISHKAEGYKQAGSGRWALWKETIDHIFERPIVGYGPDVPYDMAGEIFSDVPHNEYLECALYLGIPGLLLYLGGLFTLLVNKCKNLKKLSIDTIVAAGAAISYLISSFFGVRKLNAVCFFFLFMGMLISKKEEPEADMKEDVKAAD